MSSTSVVEATRSWLSAVDIIAAVAPAYTERTGLVAEMFVVRSDHGAREITDPDALAANRPSTWG